MEAFVDLYNVLGQQYTCFEIKGINWKTVGQEFLPRVEKVTNDQEFGLLCMELVARLEDSHASLQEGTAKLPEISLPQWDPGFACIEDDKGRPVVYYLDKGGAAEKAGIKIGMVVKSVNGRNAEDVIFDTMQLYKKYIGYSSDQYLRYHAHQFFLRQMQQNSIVKLELSDLDGKVKNYELPAMYKMRYIPRLPVPKDGIADSGEVTWKMLNGDIGYIYVRRIKENLVNLLDKAVDELKNAKGIIIDVRGNSGGGFDSSKAFLNFALDKDSEEPERPRFKGPIALLIDSRCISAGEGWASWFVATGRAKLFGSATAGASSRKTTYELKNGLYKVQFSIKAYTGSLNRPIERIGLVPDVPVVQSARDIAKGIDTVLETARKYLIKDEANLPIISNPDGIEVLPENENTEFEVTTQAIPEPNKEQIILQADVVTIKQPYKMINEFLTKETGLPEAPFYELTETQIQKFKEWAVSFPGTNIVSNQKIYTNDGQSSRFNLTSQGGIFLKRPDPNAPSDRGQVFERITSGIQIKLTPHLKQE